MRARIKKVAKISKKWWQNSVGELVELSAVHKKKTNL